MEDGDFDLPAHRRKHAFFYERAHVLEISALDVVGWLRGPVTTLVNGSSGGKKLNPEVPELVVTNLEAAFTVAVTSVRLSPTFAALTPDEREYLERELFAIQFEE